MRSANDALPPPSAPCNAPVLTTRTGRDAVGRLEHPELLSEAQTEAWSLDASTQ